MRLSQGATTGNQRAPQTTHLFRFTVIFLVTTVAFRMMNAMNFTGDFMSVLSLSFAETSDATAMTIAPVEETESPPAAAATEVAGDSTPETTEKIEPVEETESPPAAATTEGAGDSTPETTEKIEPVEETESPPAAAATEGASDSTPETTEKAEPVSETPEKQGEDNVDFKRYEKVVIVTKIHGPHQWMLLEQSLCLLHFAYNHKVLYDIVAFTATPVEQDQIDAVAKVLAPAKFTLVMDNIGFQEEIAALTPAKRDQFLERCQVSSPENLTWWSNCREPGATTGNGGRVAYNWQAEFRSVRIWDHPALANYKYMLWMDSDGFPSRPWTKDPVGYFIENKGVVMFDHFPQGNSPSGLSQRIVDSFNASVCDLNMDDSGKLVRTVITPEEHKYLDEGNKDKAVKCTTYKRIPLIHGFLHITDLDFYRQPKVLNGLKGLLGDCFLCRSPDDQLAVTIGPAIYAPERSWDMRRHGFNLQVYHNSKWDGQYSEKELAYTRYWREGGKENLPAADGVCKILAGNRR